MAIPSTQSAAVKVGSGPTSTAPIKQIPVQTPGPGQILVKLSWSGLCGTDKSMLCDDWAASGGKMQEACLGVAGHEGVGTVVQVGSDVQDLWRSGDRAGIKWCVGTCRQCEFCTNGRDELQCTKKLMSGLNWPGTFQEYCLTDARYATRIPEGIKEEEAGPIMCGGISAYGACKRSQVAPGQWVVILGAGGGLGHLGIQYAKAMGMRIIAVDGGGEKQKLCMSLGAEHYIDFETCQNLAQEIHRLTKYGSHGVIVFAASMSAYQIAPMLLRPGGTQVCVGMPRDPMAVVGSPMGVLGMRRLNIVGTLTGTLKEVDEALDFTARGLVHPVLMKADLKDLDKYLKMMEEGKVVGRVVLKIGS